MPLLTDVRNLISTKPKPSADSEAKTVQPTPVKYKEYTPQELLEDYRKFTPEWLYSRIDWRLQARHLQDIEPNTTREKLKIGLTIAVLVVGAILVLCLVAIGAGGK